MELRVMEYFLAVAREQNISRAADFLHLTQPTLSRQIKDLEEEFGKQLLIRGKRKITLTDDGVQFRKMAEEIVSLSKRAETQMKSSCDKASGDIYIGTGESEELRNIIDVAKAVQQNCPDIRFHFTSGDNDDLRDRLDKGLFDFCILYGDIDQTKYDYISLPYAETWALLMRSDSELAKKDIIRTEDLWDKPLILSRRTLSSSGFMKWIGKEENKLNITNTYNLVYCAKLMAEAGMGYVLTLDKLVNTQGTDLCFRPIIPAQTLNLSLVWKKYRVQSKAAERFISELTKHIGSTSAEINI